jgi:hypothetical protein
MDPVDVYKSIYDVCLGNAHILPVPAFILGAGGLRPDEATTYGANTSLSGGFGAVILNFLLLIFCLYTVKKHILSRSITCACISQDNSMYPLFPSAGSSDINSILDSIKS